MWFLVVVSEKRAFTSECSQFSADFHNGRFSCVKWCGEKLQSFHVYKFDWESMLLDLGRSLQKSNSKEFSLEFYREQNSIKIKQNSFTKYLLNCVGSFINCQIFHVLSLRKCQTGENAAIFSFSRFSFTLIERSWSLIHLVQFFCVSTFACSHTHAHISHICRR